MKSKREYGTNGKNETNGKSWQISVCFVLSVCSVFLSSLSLGGSRGDELIRYEESRISMACAYTIVVYGRNNDPLTQIVDLALDEVDRIDRLMSHYQPESP